MVQSSLKRQTAQGKDLCYSVIIPAYNEEAFLPETLADLLLAMETVPYPGEIIVVDNNSTDKTAEVALKYGATIVPEPFRQIAKARNSGARAANGVFLVFLDADTNLPPALLNQALTLLASGTCCGGALFLILIRNCLFWLQGLSNYGTGFPRPTSLLQAVLYSAWPSAFLQ